MDPKVKERFSDFLIETNKEFFKVASTKVVNYDDMVETSSIFSIVYKIWDMLFDDWML